MPKMTETRKRLMEKVKDYPQDLISSFFDETRNWDNRDARRLEYVEKVQQYEKNLMDYYGDKWPEVRASRYGDVTLAERMFAKPSHTFEQTNFYRRADDKNYIAEREAGYQTNYAAGLFKTGRGDLAERVAALSPRQWVAFSLNAPDISLFYLDYEDDEDPIRKDVEDALDRVEEEKNEG